MENITMFKEHASDPATGRGRKDQTEQPMPVRRPVPAAADRTARLDALERGTRQWPAGERTRVDVHGTVPGSRTMRRAGEVFAMQPVNRRGVTDGDQ
ncbi:MAG: hypothetical protein ABFC89_10415 [Methanospirillum sp.]